MLNTIFRNFFKAIGFIFLLSELINVNFALFIFGVPEKYLPIYFLTGWYSLPVWIMELSILHLLAIVPIFIFYKIYVRDFGASTFTKWMKWAMILDVLILPIFVITNMAG